NQFINKEYQQLKRRLQAKKISKIAENKAVLKQRIEDGIIERFYYKKGVYQYHLKNDQSIVNAVNLLKNTKRHQQILGSKK
ncbi:MAG: peptidase S41, partial [Flavobacteriaceae bacterium]|nr:peptidase S41 [Flavobacteriaceae bacterium]